MWSSFLNHSEIKWSREEVRRARVRVPQRGEKLWRQNAPHSRKTKNAHLRTTEFMVQDKNSNERWRCFADIPKLERRRNWNFRQKMQIKLSTSTQKLRQKNEKIQRWKCEQVLCRWTQFEESYEHLLAKMAIPTRTSLPSFGTRDKSCKESFTNKLLVLV